MECKTYNFSREITTMLKGILAIGIILHHLSQRTNTIGIIDYFQELGAPFVSIFFFISGYGLISAMVANRNDYFKTFLSKRLSTVLTPFILAIVIYQILAYLDTQDFQINLIFEKLITGNADKLLPFSWYVFEIIYFYLLFYVIFLLNKKKLFENILLVFVFTILTIYFLKSIPFGDYWYVSSLAFPLGLLCGYLEKHTNKSISLSSRLILIIIFSILIVIKMFEHTHFATMLLYPLFIYIFTLNIPISNSKFLLFLGKISYEIYLMQGISIMLLRGEHIKIENHYIYIILSIIITLPLAILLNKLSLYFKKIVNYN